MPQPVADEKFMQRCLQLARLGEGSVSPNPMVGAVLVHQDKIIGEGWHQQYGKAHAEVNCINSVKDEYRHLIGQSILYVSLEPCFHYGKTPPCSLLIVENKIPKVVIACKDPFDKVAGKGIQQLIDNNVEVIQGVLENEAQELNRRFFTFHKCKRPFVILKWAESSNGFIASSSKNKLMLSNDLSQRMVHLMRNREDAIMVGYSTALDDNPMLNVRYLAAKRQPVRIVLDFKNDLPQTLHLFDNQQPTIVFNFQINKKVENTEWIAIEQSDKEEGLLTELYRRNITSIIIEGGTKTLQPFIDKGLWDEAVVIKTGKIIAKGIKAPEFSSFKSNKKYNLTTDTIVYFSNS